MFPIPDLKAMAQRTNNAFRANLKGTDAWLWPNNVGVSAKVFAGAVWEVFCKLREIDKQRFPDTAFDDGLDHWGRIYDLGKKSASHAQGFVSVPVPYPFEVPANTAMVRSDGLIYRTTKVVVSVPYSNTGVVIVPVTCETAGAAGNCVAGTPLAISLAGLSTAGTALVAVDDRGIGGGADIETPDQYKARILARIRQPPMGGAGYDYEAWAKDVPGVTRVFVVGNAYGRGTVGVWFMMDDTYPQGIPLPSDVATVQNYINLVAPATAVPIVAAAIPNLIDVVVKGVYPESPDVYQSVAAELLATFRRMGSVSLPKRPFTLRYQWLQQAVNNATGEEYNQGVTQPTTDIPFATGMIPVLNSVKFLPAD